MCKEWTSLSRDELGDPHYAPVQTMLYRFNHVIEDLEDLEQAAIRAVQGKEYTEEDEDDRYAAIWDAMKRVGLSERERYVFSALYLENERPGRISYVDEDPWWEHEGIPEEERERYRRGDYTQWAKVDYYVPHKHTQKEVAEMLGLSQSAVSKLAKSARDKMFKEIGWLG
jgi:hypothetical protein